MIFDFFNSINDIEGPVIPLDFTEEEIKEAKNFAYNSIYKNFSGIENKQSRIGLPQTFKELILMNLISSFNLAVDKIKKRKS